MQAMSEAWLPSQGVCAYHPFWPWTRLKGQKSQIMVNIKLIQDFEEENISVKLWHDACNCWGVIAYIKPHWLWASLKDPKYQMMVNVKLIWYVDMENVPVKLQDCVCNSWWVIALNLWNSKEVTQRSTSHSSYILRWRLSV